MNKSVPPILLATLLTSTHALGSECNLQPLAKRWQSAEYVFSGTVTHHEKHAELSGKWCETEGPSCGAKLATLEVDKVWKGTIPKHMVNVFSEDACYCLGTYFKTGTRYIVFGTPVSTQNDLINDLGACHTTQFHIDLQNQLDQLAQPGE